MPSNVQSGRYVDYGQDYWNRWRWVVSADSAAYLSTFIGVITVIGLARLMRIALRIYDIRYPDSGDTHKPGSADGRGWRELKHGIGQLSEGEVRLGSNPVAGDPPNVQLDPAETPPTRKRQCPTIIQPIWSATRKFFASIRGYVVEKWNLFWAYIKGISERAGRNFRDRAWKSCLAGIGCLLLWVGFQALGVVSGRLREGTLALASNPDSGFWWPNGTTKAEDLQIRTVWERNSQIESARIAQNCFGPSPAIPGVCTFFLDTSIDVKVSNTTCPFALDMCAVGVQPLRLSTTFNARKLGVNAAKTIEVNRTTICSPLNMNSTFIRAVNRTASNITYGYFYGPVQGSGNGMTFESYRRDGSIGDVAGYNVVASWDHYDIPDSEWQPIEAIRPTPGTSVTLIMVNSQRTFYDTPRNDPIFPAHEQSPLPISNELLWVNGPAGPATVMACKEWNLWRDPQNSQHWNTSLQSPLALSNGSIDQAGLFMTQYALHASNIYGILSRRLESGLEAQTKIASLRSLPLPDPQWPIEAEQLFKTSIASMFVSVRDIAFGTGKRYPGYIKRDFFFNDGKLASFSGVYLFNANGWANFNYRVGLACLLLWKRKRATADLAIQLGAGSDADEDAVDHQNETSGRDLLRFLVTS